MKAPKRERESLDGSQENVAAFSRWPLHEDSTYVPGGNCKGGAESMFYRSMRASSG